MNDNTPRMVLAKDVTDVPPTVVVKLVVNRDTADLMVLTGDPEDSRDGWTRILGVICTGEIFMPSVHDDKGTLARLGFQFDDKGHIKVKVY